MVERPHEETVVAVDLWPVLVFKPVAVDVASQQPADVNALLNQDDQVVLEQIVKCKRVLVVQNVLNDLVDSSQLVVLNCNVDGGPIFLIAVDDGGLLEEDWIL